MSYQQPERETSPIFLAFAVFALIPAIIGLLNYISR